MTEFETDYLAHHGIKGQKWGIRRTPEELGHKPKAPKAPKKSVFEKAEEKRRQIREKNSADKREALKDYLRKHPKKMPKYAKALSQEEVNALIKDIEFDRKLKTIRDDEIKNGWKKVKDFSDNVGTLKNLINNSKDLYNTAADINNTLIDMGVTKNGKKWPKVGGNETPKEDRSIIDKIVRTGTKAEVLSNIGNMTSKEIEDAVKRIKYEEQLKEDRSAIDKIVRTGTKDEILSNIGNMTSKELTDAMTRLNYEKQLRDKDNKK